MNQAADGLDEMMNETARNLAQMWGLVRDGVIVCSKCENRPALLPTLECPHCRAARIIARHR